MSKKILYFPHRDAEDGRADTVHDDLAMKNVFALRISPGKGYTQAFASNGRQTLLTIKASNYFPTLARCQVLYFNILENFCWFGQGMAWSSAHYHAAFVCAGIPPDHRAHPEKHAEIETVHFGLFHVSVQHNLNPRYIF